MKHLSQHLNNLWYHSQRKPLLLRWASRVYDFFRKLNQYLKQKQAPLSLPLPVVVIGNLTVGGTGKTPLIIAIYQKLSEAGYRVGIITRGYKNRLSHFPHPVSTQDTAEDIGDEAALLFQKTKAPIIISANRREAVHYLAKHQLCDIVLSDDGLQHYAMPRAVEIAVIDGERGFGNHELLPLGPLREPLSRLLNVDFIIVNGHPNPKLMQELQGYSTPLFYMQMQAQAPYPLHPHAELTSPLAAFAGIGNPQRFFLLLDTLGYTFKRYIFTDHHQYIANDFAIPESCIIMTEKDAIKCQNIKHKSIFALPISIEIEENFWQQLLKKPIFKR